jgi:deazaflavin-dependent oxidoreductase (nitroreductase family)
MDDAIRRALEQGHTIDITTIGRKTGQPRRIEIVFHNFDGRIYIAGAPRANRRRSWLANLEAKPAFTFHLKGAVVADLAATATEITDEAVRREILGRIARVWRRDDVDEMVRHSPLVEVHFTDATASD